MYNARCTLNHIHIKDKSARHTGCACIARQAAAAGSSQQQVSRRTSFLILCIPRFYCPDLHPTPPQQNIQILQHV